MDLKSKIECGGVETFKYYTDFFTGISENKVISDIKNWLKNNNLNLVEIENYKINPPTATMTYDCYDVYYNKKEINETSD